MLPGSFRHSLLGISIELHERTSNTTIHCSRLSICGCILRETVNLSVAISNTQLSNKETFIE